MKRFIHYLLGAAAALALFSCEKPQPEEPGDKPGPDTPPVVTEEGLYVYGAATEAGFDLEAMEAFEEVGGLYSWTGYLIAGSPFQFPTQKTSVWPSYMIGEDEEGNLELVYGESEDDLVVYTVDIDGTYEILIDMRDEANIEFSIELVAPDMSKMEITELYILGDATATGWDLGKMAAFETEGDGIFTWEGPLKKDLRFRFPLQKIPDTWWPCLMAGENGKIIFGNRDADEVNTPVAEDGVYNITVDVTDKENMTYTIKLVEAGIADTEITALFMYGDATEGGWAVELSQPFTNDNGIFTWEGVLQANKEFRFNVSNESGWFFPAIVLKKGTTEAVYCEAWDENIYSQFMVDKTGVYEVVVNAQKYDAITYTITYKGEGSSEPEPELTINELYLLGDATDAGWSLDAMEAFTNDNGIFTWTGHLLATGGFRFQLSKPGDFVPALMKGETEGTLIYVETYDEAGAAQHLTVAEEGTYTIVVDVRDIENMTYTITPASAQEPMFNVTELYILGGATDTGWDIMTMGQFTNNNGVFVWEGNLKPGGDNEQFRFPLQKVPGQWWPCLVPSADGKSVILGEADGVPNDYRVEKDGKYRVTVNIYDGSLNVEYIGEREAADIIISELYILGSATDTGWSLDTMESFDNNGGIFTWTGNLKAGEEFRFPTQKVANQWWPCLVIETDGSKIFYGTSDADKRTYTVAETGVYTITIDARDINNLTYTITKNTEPENNYFVKELYLLGPATSAGWSLDAMEAFTGKDGIFTWEGHLNAGEFRFQLSKPGDFVPALMKGAEEGKLVYVTTYDEAGATPHLSVAEEGTYKIVVDGRDQNNLTYTITKL